jgi:hypothetical protein
MEFRAYRDGDEGSILELDARELPSVWNRRTLENWRWKFTGRNPAGASSIQVAEHEGSMVGHFAAVPYRLKVLEEELTASHSIGALVDRRYQKRGLLKFVGDRLMADLVARGIPYTWGFPNRRAHEFEKVALGYRDLLNFDEWRLPSVRFSDDDPPAAFRPVQAFGDEFEALWQACASGYPVAVARRPAYLEWRFRQRPDWEYFPFAWRPDDVLRGYAVLKLYREETERRGHIIDLFAHRDDRMALAGLIDGSLAVLRRRGVDIVTVWFHGNPLVEELFAARGFERAPAAHPLILRTNLDHGRQRAVNDPANWYFTMSDSTEIF